MTERAVVPEADAEKLQKLIDLQADDDGLWFVPCSITEAHLQHELRVLTDRAERLLLSLKAGEGWISVEQKLPPFEQSVLAIAESHIESTTLCRQLVSLYWESKLWNGLVSRDEFVTHWKPLDWPTAPGEAIAEGQHNPVLGAEPKGVQTRPSEAKATPKMEGRTGTANVPTGANSTEGQPNGDMPQESWEIQCGAPDRDGWCCGLSTGHAGDHDFHASVWDVFKPKPVAKDGGTQPLAEKCRSCNAWMCRNCFPVWLKKELAEIGVYCDGDDEPYNKSANELAAKLGDAYTECAKAMCEMCDGQIEYSSQVEGGPSFFWHRSKNAARLEKCKASPIWEKVKK